MDLAEKMSSGLNRFENRVGWALTELSRANFILRPRRGVYQITDQGQLLTESLSEINRNTLLKNEEYRKWLSNSST